MCAFAQPSSRLYTLNISLIFIGLLLVYSLPLIWLSGGVLHTPYNKERNFAVKFFSQGDLLCVWSVKQYATPCEFKRSQPPTASLLPTLE